MAIGSVVVHGGCVEALGGLKELGSNTLARVGEAIFRKDSRPGIWTVVMTCWRCLVPQMAPRVTFEPLVRKGGTFPPSFPLPVHAFALLRP